MAFTISNEQIPWEAKPIFWSDIQIPVLTLTLKGKWIPAEEAELSVETNPNELGRTLKEQRRNKKKRKVPKEILPDPCWRVPLRSKIPESLASLYLYKSLRMMKKQNWPCFGLVHIIWNKDRFGCIRWGLLWMDEPFGNFNFEPPPWLRLFDLINEDLIVPPDNYREETDEEMSMRILAKFTKKK